MDVAHILFGRPCQFDNNVFHHDTTNTLHFRHNGRKLTFFPLTPTQVACDQSTLKSVFVPSTRPSPSSLSSTLVPVINHSPVLLLHCKDVSSAPALSSLHQDGQLLLDEFSNIFPSDVTQGLLPLRGIEHQIDLIPGATFPNRPAYRANPIETKEIEH